MNIQVVELLETFRQKSSDIRSLAKATEVKNQLKDLLTDDEYLSLFVAYGHYMSGHSNTRLYEVLRNLISKYRGGGNPPIRNGKTFL